MVTIIQSDPDVPAGGYGTYLTDHGEPTRTLALFSGAPLPEPADTAAVIVLGGAMGVHDDARHPFLPPLKRFIRGCVDHEVPLLGICLGGQLLADVTAGTVTSNTCGEKGSLPVHLTEAGKTDPLFEGVDSSFVTFQWHNDSFAIPAGAVHLAASSACPGQAFRYGTRAWGLQFHPEVTEEIVRDWSLWTPETAGQSEQFLAEFARSKEAYRTAALRMLANFLRIARKR
jgi:GMP synthase-like glutamine amidotransferase